MHTYIIPGQPIPLARPRFSGTTVYDSQKGPKMVVGTNLRFIHGDKPLYSGALHVHLKFFMKNAKKKSGSPHIARPDLDNMVKFYLDVAIGILYEDDKQIYKITAEKIYDSNCRTEIIIEELSNDR